MSEQNTQFTTSNGTISKTLKHAYYPNGQLKSKTDAEGQVTLYRYDGLGRLSQILVKDNAEQENAFDDQSYQYDANSNRTQKSITKNANNNQQTQQYNYNNQQELSAIQTGNSKQNIQYNANGAQIQTQNQGQTQTLSYNSQGRLQSIQQANKKIAEYRYDPYQRRISKTTNKDNTQETTYYLYDDTGAGLVAEYNQNGDLIRGYGYAPNATFTTDAVYLKTPNKNTSNTQTNSPKSYTYHYYQNDHLGTPQLLLNQYSAPVWQAEYDAFGAIQTKRSSLTNNSITQPLRFAGQYHDPESNLYYNWHRYYNANTGRYISSDPIGLDGGMNLFGYVGGNPLVYNDILGLAFSCTTTDTDIKENTTFRTEKSVMFENKSYWIIPVGSIGPNYDPRPPSRKRFPLSFISFELWERTTIIYLIKDYAIYTRKLLQFTECVKEIKDKCGNVIDTIKYPEFK